MKCKSCGQTRSDIGLIAGNPDLCVNCASAKLLNQETPKSTQAPKVSRGKNTKVEKVKQPVAAKSPQKPLEASPGVQEEPKIYRSTITSCEPFELHWITHPGGTIKTKLVTYPDLSKLTDKQKSSNITLLSDSLRFHKVTQFTIEIKDERALTYYGVSSVEELVHALTTKYKEYK